ncbi:MAG: TIGR01459 family HAD-type hydrolase [Alphaproteobacteria bacterium]
MQLVAGLADIADRFDGYVIDLWGVIHDGARPFPGAVDALQRLIGSDRRVCLLSNAPRRSDHLVERLREMGVPDGAYNHLLSSGEATWRALRERPDDAHRALGQRCFMIGPDYNAGIMPDGDGVTVVDSLEDADFAVVTAWGGTGASLESYLGLLERMAIRGMVMVCGNPDLEVIQNGERHFCAGALGALYERMDGTVLYHGKPHRGVYDAALELLGVADRSRVAGIGDSFTTDIPGARGAGIAPVLVADGIHGEALGLDDGGPVALDRVQALADVHHVAPDWVMRRFVWN